MLYWGPLAIVEDVAVHEGTLYANVAPSMIEFGDRIKQIGISPKTLPVEGLTATAIQISKACQSLVISWWATGSLHGSIRNEPVHPYLFRQAPGARRARR
jgi:hypothetical protein